MGENRGTLLETRIEQAIEGLYKTKRKEGWSPSEVALLLRSGPAALAWLREESMTKGFSYFAGNFEDLQMMVIEVLFLRELTAATLARPVLDELLLRELAASASVLTPGAKKRRQRKPSPKVEDPPMFPKRRSRR